MLVTFNVSHDNVMSVTLLHKLMRKILNFGWTNNLFFTHNATKMKLSYSIHSIERVPKEFEITKPRHYLLIVYGFRAQETLYHSDVN